MERHKAMIMTSWSKATRPAVASTMQGTIRWAASYVSSSANLRVCDATRSNRPSIRTNHIFSSGWARVTCIYLCVGFGCGGRV